MEVDQHILDRLVKITSIQLTEEEKRQLGLELKQVTKWIEQLGEVNTDGIDPLLTMSIETNQFAEDIPQPALSIGEALANAPQHDGAYFLVPTKAPSSKT